MWIKQRERQPGQLEFIQALRGLACLFVMLCHTYYTKFGVYAVDFFFVISGFVIMYSTQEKKPFWKRRLVKIIPLYWFVTIVTGFFVFVFPQLFRSYEVSWEYLFKSLFFIPYTHSRIKQPLLGVGWTLNYEMLFYLVFYIAMKINHKWRGYLTIGITVVMVILGNVLTLGMPWSFWLGSTMLEFSYGILAFELYKCWTKREQKMADAMQDETMQDEEKQNAKHTGWWLFCLAVIVFVAGYVDMEQVRTFRIERAYSSAIIALVIFLIFMVWDKKMQYPKPLLYLGDISYVLYLIHIYPVRTVEHIFGMFWDPNPITVIFQLLAAVVCAAIYYELIEKRVQKMLKKWL